MEYFSWLFSLNFTRFPVGETRVFWESAAETDELISYMHFGLTFLFSYAFPFGLVVLGQHPDQGPSCSVARFGKTSSSWKCLNGSNLLPFHESLCRCASGKTQSFGNNFAPSPRSMFHYNQRLTERSLNFISWFLTSHAVRITHAVPEAWNASDASGITDMQTGWRVVLCLRTLGNQAITACF